ncbi:MAG: hypothetical protein ABIR32_02850 [Ilumatobacteraceae bacterium]
MLIHGRDADIGDLATRVIALLRARSAEAPLGRTATVAELADALRGAIACAGAALDDAWRLLTDVVLANTIGINSEGIGAWFHVDAAYGERRSWSRNCVIDSPGSSASTRSSSIRTSGCSTRRGRVR